jgi:hypothetical protein
VLIEGGAVARGIGRADGVGVGLARQQRGLVGVNARVLRGRVSVVPEAWESNVLVVLLSHSVRLE